MKSSSRSEEEAPVDEPEMEARGHHLFAPPPCPVPFAPFGNITPQPPASALDDENENEGGEQAEASLETKLCEIIQRMPFAPPRSPRLEPC